MIPVTGGYIDAGIWTIRLEPVMTVTGQYYLYLPAGNGRGDSTGFYRSTPQMTLTVPSTAAKVITVGGLRSGLMIPMRIFGRGYADSTRTIGVTAAGLTKAGSCGSRCKYPGSGCLWRFSPLLRELFRHTDCQRCRGASDGMGIVQGNDPFLYGEKIKAYLRKGARPLRGERGNIPTTGWGMAGCVWQTACRRQEQQNERYWLRIGNSSGTGRKENR